MYSHLNIVFHFKGYNFDIGVKTKLHIVLLTDQYFLSLLVLSLSLSFLWKGFHKLA